MIELKIKKKYFDAILQLKKPFELRHQAIPQNSIVKLIEISDDIKDVRNIDTHLEIMLNICKKRKEALKHSKIPVNKYCKFIKELGYSGWEEETNILNSKEFLTGRYIIFKSGRCIPLKKEYDYDWKYKAEDYYIDNDDYAYWSFENNGDLSCGKMTIYADTVEYKPFDWYDSFCWDYINKEQTYLIEIAEIMEVK